MKFKKNINQINNLFRRFYSPGFSGNHSVALPLAPNDLEVKYHKPVWGNNIQKKQLENNYQNGYNTSIINEYNKEIGTLINNSNDLNRDVVYIPTSHGASVETSLQSCRHIKNKEYYLDLIKEMNVLDRENCFIANDTNIKKILNICDYYKDKSDENEVQSVKSAIYGIISNMGDSIYIANDYLLVEDNIAFVANYPSQASQREIEKARVISILLKNGIYPILLPDHINFEGEANIKILPFLVKGIEKNYKLCLNYKASRSELEALVEINKYLTLLGKDNLCPITLYPKPEYELDFYHLDCILNFSFRSNLYNIICNETEFMKKGPYDGTVVIVKNALTSDSEYLIKKIFKRVIEVDSKNDSLIANILLTPNCAIGSPYLDNHNISDFHQIYEKTFLFEHPSKGGGGAHKCCSNVIPVNKNNIIINDWINFSHILGIDISKNLIKAVLNENKRLYK